LLKLYFQAILGEKSSWRISPTLENSVERLFKSYFATSEVAANFNGKSCDVNDLLIRRQGLFAPELGVWLEDGSLAHSNFEIRSMFWRSTEGNYS